MNQKKVKAFQDARVRRAMHLAMDRHVLVDVVKDTAPMQIGGFVYPFHEMSTPKAELEKRLGYQKDPKAAIQEAKKLMAGGRLRPGASRGSISWCAMPPPSSSGRWPSRPC